MESFRTDEIVHFLESVEWFDSGWEIFHTRGIPCFILSFVKDSICRVDIDIMQNACAEDKENELVIIIINIIEILIGFTSQDP